MDSQGLMNLINEAILSENQSVDLKLYEKILEKMYQYSDGYYNIVQKIRLYSLKNI